MEFHHGIGQNCKRLFVGHGGTTSRSGLGKAALRKCPFSPLLILSGCLFTFTGLVARWQNFLFFCLVMLLTSLAGSSVAFVAGASTRTPAIANLFSALIFVFQMVNSKNNALPSFHIILKWGATPLFHRLHLP